jgi:hypothetical protein
MDRRAVGDHLLFRLAVDNMTQGLVMLDVEAAVRRR